MSHDVDWSVTASGGGRIAVASVVGRLIGSDRAEQIVTRLG